jgi:hypothetical protein
MLSDTSTVNIMAHIMIRDFDTGEIILNRRDAAIMPAIKVKASVTLDEQTKQKEDTTDESVVIE